MTKSAFADAFESLTSSSPFPWQEEMYRRFMAGDIPSSCNLPTGLGKTAIIAIWLIALANSKNVAGIPRRLVYVVNRRTVVDQATREAENLRARLTSADRPEVLAQIAKALFDLAALRSDAPLAISTLRGQFADNREWSSDPARPAVIVGTVDMIGSRLLFSGYGVGFKGKPLHAGFLGQDVLLVHDEAHLEPAFQQLIEAIRDEQEREMAPLGQQCRLTVMELTATSRGQGQPFRLTPEDYENATVIRRIRARKGIAFHTVTDEKKQTADAVSRLALERGAENDGAAILVFLQSLEDVQTVQRNLLAAERGVQVLTGTLRGLERDGLATQDDVFARFLPEANRSGLVIPRPGTVFLICTSAGEVGVNISADHLVCDLAPLDSMAQRFGRVNRFGGDAKQAFIDLVHPTGFATMDKPRELARERSLTLLRQLPVCDWDPSRYEASPHAMSMLRERDDLPCRFQDAFTPQPTIVPVTDILLDAWALTTVRGKLPGRPDVEPYLHGISGWEPPETQVAWRDEVEVLDIKFESEAEAAERRAERKGLAKFAAELLEDYPLKPHELLKEPSYRAFKHLEALAKRNREKPVWLLDDDGKVEVLTLAELVGKNERDRIARKTVLLPPSAGGLENGMLAGNSGHADDVADQWYEDPERQLHRRVRIWDHDPEFEAKSADMRLVRRIDIPTEDEDAEDRSWRWFELPKDGDSDGSKSSKLPVLWEVHVGDVVKNASKIVSRLPLPMPLKDAIILAATFHDHGKRRKLFQRILGNFDPNRLLAKSGRRGGRIPETYRHEFGSLMDVEAEPDFTKLDDDLKDVVRHLIAVHHGRGRPHFPPDEAFDPDRGNVDAIAAEVPRRFARLQRRYGRWGLAYLESLLRAADYAASAEPSAFEKDEP